MQLGPRSEGEELVLSTPDSKEPGQLGRGTPVGVYLRHGRVGSAPPTPKQTWKLEGEAISELYTGRTVCFRSLPTIWGRTGCHSFLPKAGDVERLQEIRS